MFGNFWKLALTILKKKYQFLLGIRDACSWKRKLEKTRSWKRLSGKVRNEIERNEHCIENFPIPIGALRLNKDFLTSNFPTSKVSNFSFFLRYLSNLNITYRIILVKYWTDSDWLKSVIVVSFGKFIDNPFGVIIRKWIIPHSIGSNRF